MLSGRATEEGTRRFRERFPEAREAGHFRRLGDCWVSSIGLGTYLGEATDAIDRKYEEAVHEALARGCNLFDTAINYRHQRSERALGRALASAFSSGLAARDEVVVCTKGGFVPFDGEPPDDPAAYLSHGFLDTGLIGRDDLAADCHAMNVEFLSNQLATSRGNLDLETIDLYYLHNPETQASLVDSAELNERLRVAFELLAKRRDAGELAAYGVATWSGLRQPPGDTGALVLTEIKHLAGPGMTAVQAPLNLAMPEALASPTQELGEVAVPLLVAARALDLGLVTSASILQGQLSEMPSEIAAAMPGLETDAQRALQFTRSLPGVTTALVGMSSVEHVRENLELSRLPATSMDAIQRIFV